MGTTYTMTGRGRLGLVLAGLIGLGAVDAGAAVITNTTAMNTLAADIASLSDGDTLLMLQGQGSSTTKGSINANNVTITGETGNPLDTIRWWQGGDAQLLHTGYGKNALVRNAWFRRIDAGVYTRLIFTHGVSYSNCVFDGLDGFRLAQGVAVGGGFVDNCEVRFMSTRGLQVGGDPVPEDTTIANVFVHSISGIGIDLGNIYGDAATVYKIYIADSVISNCTAAAITAEQPLWDREVHISGCTITDNATNGIEFVDTSRTASADGSTISNCTISASGSWGIYLDDHETTVGVADVSSDSAKIEDGGMTISGTYSNGNITVGDTYATSGGTLQGSGTIFFTGGDKMTVTNNGTLNLAALKFDLTGIPEPVHQSWAQATIVDYTGGTVNNKPSPINNVLSAASIAQNWSVQDTGSQILVIPPPVTVITNTTAFNTLAADLASLTDGDMLLMLQGTGSSTTKGSINANNVTITGETGDPNDTIRAWQGGDLQLLHTGYGKNALVRNARFNRIDAGPLTRLIFTHGTSYSNCVFDGLDGFRLAQGINVGGGFVDNCVVRFMSTRGLQVGGDPVPEDTTIANVLVHSISGIGIDLTNIYGDDNTVYKIYIADSVISNCANAAITAEQPLWDREVHISGCTITDSGTNGIEFVDTSRNESADGSTISNCTISASGSWGIYLDDHETTVGVADVSSDSAKIEDGGMTISGTYSNGNITVGDTYATSGGTLQGSGTIFFADGDKMTVTNNGTLNLAALRFDLTGYAPIAQVTIVDYTGGTVNNKPSPINNVLSAATAALNWSVQDTGTQILATPPPATGTMMYTK